MVYDTQNSKSSNSCTEFKFYTRVSLLRAEYSSSASFSGPPRCLNVDSPSHNAECSSHAKVCLLCLKDGPPLSSWPLPCSLANPQLTVHPMLLQLTLLSLNLDRRGLVKISESSSTTKIIPPLPPNSVVYSHQILNSLCSGSGRKV